MSAAAEAVFLQDAADQARGEQGSPQFSFMDNCTEHDFHIGSRCHNCQVLLGILFPSFLSTSGGLAVLSTSHRNMRCSISLRDLTVKDPAPPTVQELPCIYRAR